ncbi:MAG: hypothetical protein DMG77_18480 [Acidobacteria bacterium]|nr:MAG: hypothetical protein DMG77_18480 [Acidobacteriota bacterium]
MTRRFYYFVRAIFLFVSCLAPVLLLEAQGGKQTLPGVPLIDSDADHVKQRNEWFFRGRVIRGKPSAELRRRAYQAKMQLRALRSAALERESASTIGQITSSGGSGLRRDPSRLHLTLPVPECRTITKSPDAQPQSPLIRRFDWQSRLYRWRAGGVGKSTNAANNLATDVAWTPVTDDQATLSVGSIAIQPGNGDPAKSLILVGRGEANNAGDSYFGLGILRSTDAGNTWSLISTANAGHGRSDRQQRLQVIYRRQMGWDRSMVHLRRRAAAMFGSRPMLREGAPHFPE